MGSTRSLTCRIIALICTAIVLFIIGFIIGFYSAPEESSDKTWTTAQTMAEQRKAVAKAKNGLHKKLYRALDAKEIGKNLRYFSARPHIAATKRSKELADEIAKRWREYGFDKVEQPKYNVLLPYIDPNVFNTVTIFQKNGSVALKFTGKLKTVDPSEDDPTMIPPLLGYAKQGAANGTLLYVNYGTREDFQELRNKLGISDCKGKIVIMRYNEMFRGAKVKRAENCGAVGAILYHDPKDYAPYGQNQTYPRGHWLPKTAVQRGTLLSKANGDPLTPGLPSIDGVPRIPKEEAGLPKIPAIPLSYGDAVELLKLMKGKDVPESWKGGLPIVYKIGDEGLNDDETIEIQVNVPTKRQDVYNVIGTIYGKEEPDRWVMIGNHRDSWGFGAVDASSGTSTIMEIARGLKDLLDQGWQPRRTIKFCSWGGEESGMIGSTEWVEANQGDLSAKGVTYINVDISVEGNETYQASGSPLFKPLIFDHVKKIEDPHMKNGKKVTVYERMVETGANKKTPNYAPVGSGSDFVAFYQFIGVPCVDMIYKDKVWYPVYHTVHDTYKWLQLIDPYFLLHLTTGRVAARVLIETADSLVLPLDVTAYAEAVSKSLEILKKNHGEILKANNASLSYLEQVVKEFEKATEKFKKEKDETNDSKTDLQIRNLNNRIVNVEKAFIHAPGLPGRPTTRHVLYAPSISNWYAATSFPGITDLLAPMNQTSELDWKEIKKQISIVYLSVLRAIDALKPDRK